MIDPGRQDGWREPIFTSVNLWCGPKSFGWALVKDCTPIKQEFHSIT